MKTVIYFGDNDYSIADKAKLHDKNALLIDNSNYKDFLGSAVPEGVFYTSLSDLPKDLKIVSDILHKSDLIVYSPPTKWSDNKELDVLDVTNSIQGLSELLLLQVSCQVEVKNIELCYESKFSDKLADERKNLKPQLWISGCSVSHGEGVTVNERYGTLLGKKLQLDVSFLTAPGSSIEWAANQILKSDLRKGDILCWGLTNFSRLPYYTDTSLRHVNSGYYQMHKEFEKILPIKYICDKNRLFKALESIKTVINFCNKLEVNLIMFNALIDNQLYRLVNKEKCFYQYPYQLNKDFKTYDSHGLFVHHDLGSDNLHPGPVTHQHYSNFLAHIIDTRQQ